MKTVTRSIKNTEDVIDSRDVIARLEYLEPDVLECEACNGKGEYAGNCGEAEHDEYRALKELQDEAEGYSPDWIYGSTLIRDSYFKDYAQELAEDIGAVKGNEEWPLRHIDWDSAAAELKQDYTSVTFDGIDYWIR